MKSLFDLLIDVLNVLKVESFHFQLQLLTNLSFASGDIALTEEAFLAVNGELGTGRTNIEWKFI